MSEIRVTLDARTATDHFPGVGRYVHGLARGLPGVGVRLSLLCDPSATDTRFDFNALPASADLGVDRCDASPFGLSQQWQVPRTLRALEACLYHSPYYLMPYRPGLPTILTVYDLVPLQRFAGFTAWSRLVFRVAHHLALRSAEHAIAISEATRRDVIAAFGADPERITVIPLAVDSRFRPQPGAKIDRMRSHYGLPERYVLYLGINKPHKNLVRLVEAWARLDVESSRHRLVIAGMWDPRYPEAKIRAEELELGDAVLFLGPVADDDLPALYSGADLFAFPSLYEGFGLPVLEAMACGAPVLCSDRASLPEVTGDAALAVDPLDEMAMAETIQRSLNDQPLRQEIREKGLQRARGFSWERTARGTINVYRKVAVA